MLEDQVEDVLKAYVAATQQGSGAALNGLAIYAGHAVATIAESQTGAGYAVVAATEQRGELAHAGIYRLGVRWILRAPATTAGKASLKAWSQAIVDTFCLGQLDTVAVWINTTQAGTIAVGINGLEYLGSARGAVVDREQVGVELAYEGDFFIPP